jgi:hypothetical protein
MLRPFHGTRGEDILEPDSDMVLGSGRKAIPHFRQYKFSLIPHLNQCSRHQRLAEADFEPALGDFDDSHGKAH